MDPFVRRLIQRLNDPSSPLTRNRHFHTFDTPEGRLALRTSRRLKALRKDILRCQQAGELPQVEFQVDVEGQHRVELRFEGIKGRRSSLLRQAEYELLRELDGMAELLGPAKPKR
jgi:hypothetical protein